MDCPKKPCEDLEKLREDVDKRFREQESRLNAGEVNFAVIKTKLNLILGVMSALGACLIPMAYNMLFK